MIIEHIKLRNFGIHRDFERHFKGSVIGLIGPNGSGKSTITLAVEYALTGELPGEASSWIRNGGEGPVDPKTGKASKLSAFVEVAFVKHGTRGLITREIYPTRTKRKLVWEGKEYTAAAEVDSLLREIFSADKKAIQSCVFIPQGDLANMLFGRASEREALFIKLLQMGHMQKVSDGATGERKLLLNEVEDFSVVKDEILSQIRSVAETLDVSQRAFQSLQDPAPELDRWRSLLREHEQVQQYRSLLVAELAARDRVEIGLRQSREYVTRLLNQTGSPANPVTLLDAELTLCDQRVQYLSGQESQLRVALEQRKQLTLRATIAGELATCSRERDRLDQELAQVTDEQTIKQELDRINEQLLKAARRTRLLTDALAREQENAARQPQLSVLQSRLQDLESQLTPQQASLAEKQRFLTLLRTVLTSGAAADESHCPLCRNQLQASQHLGEIEKQTAQEVQTLQETVTRLTSQLTGERHALTELTAQHTACAAHIATYREELQTLEGTYSEDPEKDKAKLESLRANLTMIQDLKLQASRVHAQHDSLRARLMQFEVLSPEQETFAQAATAEALTGLQQQLQQVRDTQKELQAARQQLVALEDQHTTLRDRITQLERQMAAIMSKNEWIEPALDEVRQQLDTTILTLEEKRSAYEQHAGQLTALRSQREQLDIRLKDIQDREERNRQKLQLADELRALASAFDRNGLPRAYCLYRFEQLAALTLQNLQAMGADFTVEPDPEQNLTFQFTRLDDPSGYTMPQEKLSGGQRVRLSVAFLLAVQRLIIPDLGFLVLDEPSLHLDRTARQDLKDLLLGLGAQLQNSEAQVIVCDHSEDLAPAFQAVLQTGNSTH